ncbi:MAG: hypothetical protein IT428_14530 [Planctomycetaceae bacterium]|nr:hypothetical protein [Planctomycetaceae bacterium]
MTEQEWLSTTDLCAMLFQAHDAHIDSDRKLRLLLIACCRRIWNNLSHPQLRAAVKIGERYAEGEVSDPERSNAFLSAVRVTDNFNHPVRDWTWVRELAKGTVAHHVGYVSLLALFDDDWLKSNPTGNFAERPFQADLMRDVFGLLPFRTMRKIDRRRTNAATRKLAGEIYSKRLFRLMPALGDSLAESPVATDEMIAHCRASTAHVRGCWVLDLVLGKR